MAALDFKLLTQDNIPCWYELSWRAEEPAIVLRVHKDFIKNTKIVSDEAPIVSQSKEEFGFKDFVGNFDGDFGFDKAFIRHGETEEFVEFLVKIPRVKKETGKKCSYCQGSGRDERLDNKCISCDGKGKEYIYDWQPAYSISASLAVFSRLSEYPEKETSSNFLQLLIVTSAAKGGLSGMYSISLCQWLSSFELNTEIPEMVQAMQLAYGYMMDGLSDYDRRHFRAVVAHKGGWLNIDCPGTACGLYPSRGFVKEGEGYEFCDHNVDNPMQQITLLAGLAALHDRARKELQV
ncbi:MAG: hypothetical protein KAV87_08815 [Desulfobacteraceae bacterium]|nr:hypothetical protein [Desulfobacteraceae bacterium]